MFKSEDSELSSVEVGQIVVLQYADDPIEGPLEELTVDLLLLVRHQLICWHLLVVWWKPLHALKASAYALEVLFCDQTRYLLFEWQRLVSFIGFKCGMRLFMLVLASHVIADGLRAHVKGLKLTLYDFVGFIKGTLALLFLCEEHVLCHVWQQLCDEDIVHEFEQPRLHLIRSDHLQLRQILHLLLVSLRYVLLFLDDVH